MHLRDVRQTLDGMGISRAPFIGFSFGGRLAMELVASPDRSRVEKLVLLDPAIQLTPERVTTSTTALLSEASWSSPDEAIEDRIAGAFAPYAPREHWELWSEGLVEGTDGRLRLPFSRPAAIAIYSELATPPPPYDSLRVPTLVIVGSESELVTPKQRERYRYELGDFFELKPVRAKHNVIADAADEVAASIKSFLAR